MEHNTHLGEFDTFLNFTNLDAKIINPLNTDLQYNILPPTNKNELHTEPTTKPKYASRGRPSSATYINFASDEYDNVLLAIQNSPKFVGLIKSIARPLHPSVYICAEDGVLTCIISSAQMYPIVMNKFVVREPNYYLKPNVRLCYKFPSDELISFLSQGVNEVGCSILFTQENKNVYIEFYDTYKIRQHRILAMDAISQSIMIQEVFTNKLSGPEHAEFDHLINATIDYSAKFKSMPLLFIREISTDLNFSRTRNNPSAHVIRITDDMLTLEVIGPRCVSKLVLADESNMLVSGTLQVEHTRHNSQLTKVLYWDRELRNKNLRFVNYAIITKGGSKLASKLDYIYYCVCRWDVSENTYAFVKVITQKNVKDVITRYGDHEPITFETAFADTDVIMEFVVCIDEY